MSEQRRSEVVAKIVRLLTVVIATDKIKTANVKTTQKLSEINLAKIIPAQKNTLTQTSGRLISALPDSFSAY